MTPDLMVGYYSHFDKVFRVREVPSSGPPSLLHRAETPISLTWTYQGQPRTLDAYLDSNPVTGLLIARDDTILYERYRYGRTDVDRFLSQSMVKTVVGLLVGIALHEGKISSVGDTVATYVPELEGSEYGGTSIRALLHMSSGVQFRETYRPGGDDLERLGGALFTTVAPTAAVRQFNTRIAPPDTEWHYSSAETEVLGLVVARATAMHLTEYLSSRLWQPMGMEGNAAWAIDSTGQEIAYCCFVARLRDWARIGLMLANDGKWNGRQIVPREWLLESTTAPAVSTRAPGRIAGFLGYGNQMFLLPGDRRAFLLVGIHGQRMFVDPLAKLIMLQTGVFDLAGGSAAEEIYSVWGTLVTLCGH